jgi:Tfp pilus assembly protein PilF
LADLSRSLQLNPNVAGCWSIRARTYLQLRQPEATLHDWLQAIRLSPDRADFHYGLGEAYFNLGLFREAMAAFSQAIIRDPQDAGAFSFRAAASSSSRSINRRWPIPFALCSLVRRKTWAASTGLERSQS